MEKLLEAFRPWLDAHPEVDAYWTDTAGCVCVSRIDDEPLIRYNVDRPTLLTVIAAWFVDAAEPGTWGSAAMQAVIDMQPYLEQLPQDDTETIRTILGLFLKFDEECSPRQTAPS